MKDNIKAVLFDHDDTLVATREVKWAHHKQVAKKFYNKTLTDDDIAPHWGKPFPELVCILYGTDNSEEALTNNMSSYKDFPKILYEGTIPTLTHLRKSGKLTGIVTATIRTSFENDINSLNIPLDILDYTQTAEESDFHKPDPRVFDKTLVWLKGKNIEPHEALYVGDGLHDMRAAIGAGFNFVGVETGLTKAKQFIDEGVLSVPTIKDLIKLFK